MKGLKFAIEWIALNDSAGDGLTEEEISGLISVVLIADLFDKDPREIARKIVKFRETIVHT